ncbi:MAG: hypothetical protein WA432_02275 [Candidatus Babeliaceae bacterium]
MDGLTFIANINAYLEKKEYFVWCFVGKKYPALFFYHLNALIKKSHSLVYLDIQEKKNILYEQTQTSFLGKSLIYWCKNISDLSYKELEHFLEYIRTYQGPHVISFFCNDAKIVKQYKNCIVIELDFAVTYDTYKSFYQLFFAETIPSSFTMECLPRSSPLSLDAACTFMSYQTLLGRRYKEFFEHWHTRLGQSESSLFHLSSLFFGYREKLFLQEWYVQKKNYPTEFWIVFWLELVWQAFTFVTLEQHVSLIEAKKNTIKLPFSFLQKDWQLHKAKNLAKAHNFLYEFDYRLKNGLPTDAGLDLFMYKFMRKQF